MADQPTDWIKDAGWYSELRKTARYGSDEAFDALLARLLSEHAREVLAQPDTLGGGGVFERFPDAFDDRQRPVCGVWNPLLGPCVCGNPDGHTTQPSATSERGGLDG